MSGLVAIVSHRTGQSVDPADIESLAASYESLRGTGVRRALSTEDGRARVVALGSPGGIGARVESRADAAGCSWTAVSGVPHHLGPLIDARAEDLDGQFALVSACAQTGTVTAATDPFGMHALYAAERDGRTYLSTSSLALAKHLRARPSRYGLSLFLRAGSHFPPVTNWEGIRRLDPGTLLRFDGSGAKAESYWRPEPDRTFGSLSLERTVDACLEVLVQTSGQYWADGVPRWADLTGGFDSRLMTLALARAGAAFSTNTRDEEPDDVDIAGQIAAGTGWDWDLVRMPARWETQLPAMLRTALAWGDGNLEVLELSWVLWAHASMGRRMPRLLSAGGGETFQYNAWKQELMKLRAGRSSRVNLDDFITMRLLRSSIDRSLLAVDPTPEIRDELRDRLTSWVQPYADELNTTQLDVLYAYRSTGHFGAYHAADYASLAAELPFYTKPVFTAAFSANHRWRNYHRLMRHMIERLDPRVAALPVSHGGTAQPWRARNVGHALGYYRTVGRKAVNKVGLSKGLRLLSSAVRFDPAPLAARRAVLRTFMEDGDLRAENLRCASLFKPRALEAFLRAAAQREQIDLVTLGRILTVEMMLREVGTDL